MGLVVSGVWILACNPEYSGVATTGLLFRSTTVRSVIDMYVFSLEVARLERYLMAFRSVNPSIINTIRLSLSIELEWKGSKSVRVYCVRLSPRVTCADCNVICVTLSESTILTVSENVRINLPSSKSRSKLLSCGLVVSRTNSLTLGALQGVRPSMALPALSKMDKSLR